MLCYPAEVALRDIAQVGLKFCYLLGGHIIFLFKSEHFAFQQLSFSLRLENVLLDCFFILITCY